MQTVLIAIHLMVVAALVVVVLLQRSEGGALGIGGGGGFMTGRGAGNALTRATAVLATIFFITSLMLTVLANMNRSQKSIFEGQTNRPAQTAPANAPAGAPAAPGTPPAGGSLFEQLQRLDQQPAAPATGGAPATGTPPAAPATGTPPQPAR